MDERGKEEVTKTKVMEGTKMEEEKRKKEI